MKKSRKGLTLILTAAMALSLTACGSSPSASAYPAPAGNTAAGTAAAAADDGQTYVINIGHINDERDSWHQGSEKFKEYVEEHSGGCIQVNIYPSSQLGTEVDMIQSILTQGGCDITFTGESMQTYQPDLGIIGMPYLIKSDAHMEAVLTGEVGAELEGLMEKSGMKVLGYFTRGPRNVTANKKITSPADMNNFVIRTPQSAMTVAAFEAVGAKPTPMALAEVFTSLQQVVVDGGKEMQKYEHEIFLKNEEELESKLVEEGMEFVDVDQTAFSDAMTNGVLAVLTGSQKALYEKISAANPDA